MQDTNPAGWLRESGASSTFQERLAAIIAEYWQRVQSIPEVVGLEIGFMPKSQTASGRDFGDFPTDGVVHLVTIVPSNVLDSQEDTATYWQLNQAETAIAEAFPGVPIDFHIAAQTGFPGRSGPQMFEKITPPGTLHLASIVKPAVGAVSE